MTADPAGFLKSQSLVSSKDGFRQSGVQKPSFRFRPRCGQALANRNGRSSAAICAASCKEAHPKSKSRSLFWRMASCQPPLMDKAHADCSAPLRMVALASGFVKQTVGRRGDRKEFGVSADARYRPRNLLGDGEYRSCAHLSARHKNPAVSPSCTQSCEGDPACSGRQWTSDSGMPVQKSSRAWIEKCLAQEDGRSPRGVSYA